MHKLEELFAASSSPADYAARVGARVKSILSGLDYDAVAELVQRVEETAASGHTIFAIANGGSAAVASHFVNDLGVNALVPGRHGYRVVSLCDNVESITAVANDSGFENVFLHQLQCGVQAGDLVIAMSVSGNSPNIIRAVEFARTAGAHVVGMCGFDGGRLADLADVVVHVPTTPDEYGPVEDVFSIVCHITSGFLTMKRGRRLSH